MASMPQHDDAAFRASVPATQAAGVASAPPVGSAGFDIHRGPAVARLGFIEELTTAGSLADALRAWAAVRVRLGERLTLPALQARLGEDLAAIDVALGRQIDAILHHPAFMSLEASWRGLFWLLEQAGKANDDSDGQTRVEVRVLSVTKRELARDRASAVEFDRSQLWRKVYEDEFGTAGGTPYGLLVTDFEFGQHPDDVNLLTGLSEVAAAAFAPLLATPRPELLGLDSFASLEGVSLPAAAQAGPDFLKWRGLREREESRFVALPLPRVLARRPYDGWLGRPQAPGAREQSWALRGFRYREQSDGGDTAGRPWMSAVWPLAAVIVREFGRSSWFADIRGASRGLPGGGLVEDLPTDGFDALDATGALRGPTESFVTEDLQQELDTVGIVPLCATGPDGRAVFHSNATLHRPETFDDPAASMNARISSMLQYVLCASRFAHYLKVLARDKLGSFTEAPAFERFLSQWVNRYVTPDDQASAETRARMPLRAAAVEVREEPGTAGGSRVVMRLQPHFQIDRLDATLKLVSSVRRTHSR